MLNLKVIITSTRPGRKGPAIAEAFMPVIKENTLFETQLVDLDSFQLPMLDEPNHPRFKQYTQDHTKRWSVVIDDADAFIFVLPEYNFSMPASVKNMIDFLSQEWAYKPVGFISYGGVSAGLRAVDNLVPVIRAMKMVAVIEGVHLAMFNKHFDAEGKFVVDDGMKKAAQGMMAELAKWAGALRTMRVQ